MATKNKPRLIKKYPNRRLYDTQTSSYVTLSDIKELVISGEEFIVSDTKSSKNITRSILLQIILEEEAGNLPIFTETMLAQIIRFYGHSMQGMMGNYLEKNIQIFTETQNKFNEYSKSNNNNLNPFVSPEAWTKIMSNQPPNLQNFMTNYLDQTKDAFSRMEKQMQMNTRSMFGQGTDPKSTKEKKEKK